MEKFWRCLASAHLDASTSVLSFAHGTTLHGVSSSILVRDCYDTLAAAVQKAPLRALVRGTPGVGTTVFAVYFAWLHLRRPGVGAIVYDAWNTRVVIKDGAARLVEQHPLCDHLLLDDPTTLYIADGTPPSPSSCCTLVVAAPVRRLFGRWLKDSHKVVQLFVPPFTADEMERCRARCYPHLDAAAVARAFDTWGGTARRVLRDHQGSWTRLPAYLSCMSLDGLDSALRVLLWAAVEAESDAPHDLLHLVPTDGRLRGSQVAFASRFGADAFYNALRYAGEPTMSA